MFESLVYSNLLMLVIPVAMTLGNYALLGLHPSRPFLVALSAGTFLLYQVDRGWRVAEEDLANKPERVAWVTKYRRYVVWSSAAAAAVAASQLPALRPVTWLAMASALLVGLTYALPILPGGRRLKSIPYAKALVVGLAWAFSCTTIPILQAGVRASPGHAFLFLYRLAWVLPNLLLSNWYDRRGDTQAGVLTFAARWTSSRMLTTCRVLLCGAMLAAVFAIRWGGATQLLALDAAGLILFYILLRGGLPERPAFYLLTIDVLMAWPVLTAAATLAP